MGRGESVMAPRALPWADSSLPPRGAVWSYQTLVKLNFRQLSCRSLYQNLKYVLHVRTFESQFSCRSLNQNLPSVLDVDALLGGQGGEAAAGEGVVGGEG